MGSDAIETCAEFLNSRELWEAFDTVANNPIAAIENDLNECTIIIGALLLYRNWARPGAVCNITVEEWMQRTRVIEDGKTLVVARVHNHKTAVHQTAKLTLKPDEEVRVQQYMVRIRPCILEGKQSVYLLMLTGGRRVTNLSRMISTLGMKFGISLPTATQVRKSGASAVAQKYGSTSAEGDLIIRQLGHSRHTDAVYYQALTGPRQAAHASLLMDDLVKETEVIQGEKRGECTSNKKPNPHPKKKKRDRNWSKAEDALLRSLFGSEVFTIRVKLPTLSQIRKALHDSGLTRSPDQALNRIKNLRKL